MSYRNRKQQSLKRRAKAKPRGEYPRAANSLRDLERALKPRQMFALRHPVPVGAKTLPRDPRHERRQVIGTAEWCVRLLFDMNGARELLGPCWRAEVRLQRADDLSGTPVLVCDWTEADQMQAKAIAIAEVRQVGHGGSIDVQVGDYSVEVFRLAKVLEAAVAESMLVRDRAAAPEVTP